MEEPTDYEEPASSTFGGRSINGWKYWRYYYDVSEEWRPIDELRKKKDYQV